MSTTAKASDLHLRCRWRCKIDGVEFLAGTNAVAVTAVGDATQPTDDVEPSGFGDGSGSRRRTADHVSAALGDEFDALFAHGRTRRERQLAELALAEIALTVAAS